MQNLSQMQMNDPFLRLQLGLTSVYFCNPFWCLYMTSGLLVQTRHPKNPGFCFETWKRAQASNGRRCRPAGLRVACFPQKVLQLFAFTRRDKKRWDGCGLGLRLSEARNRWPRAPPDAAGSSSHSRSTRVPRRRTASPPPPPGLSSTAPHPPGSRGLSQKPRAL